MKWTNEKKKCYNKFFFSCSINTQHTIPTADTTENENTQCLLPRFEALMEHIYAMLHVWIWWLCCYSIFLIFFRCYLFFYFFFLFSPSLFSIRLCIGTVNRILRIFRSDWLAFRVSISDSLVSVHIQNIEMAMRQGSPTAAHSYWCFTWCV